MSKSSIVRSFGLAGSVLLTTSLVALAQEAAPASPAPAASGCSGFLCLLAPRTMAEQQAAPAATEPAAQPAAAQTAAQTAATTDPAPDVTETKPAKAKAPRPTVTIAADTAEASRLRTLVSALPKEKIRIVAETAAAPGADFAVRTALDSRPSGTEQARLFTEQMHVVAGPSIQSFADLKGKVVSFGAARSPSQTAARKAFAALGITVKETPLDLDNAFDGLATGDIDAVVLLAPQPVDRLKRLSAPGLHFVAWPEGATMPDGAVTASIDGGAYPSLAKPGEAINAMGVDAVLILEPRAIETKGSGARAPAPAAKAFLAALSQHSATLSKRGFDLLKADLDSRADRRVASVERR